MDREPPQRRQVAVYAVAVALAATVGLGRPGVAPTLEGLIDPVLALLLYVTFLEVPFVRLRRAFRNRRYVGAVVVTQTLVELVGTVVLTPVVPRWLVPGGER